MDRLEGRKVRAGAVVDERYRGRQLVVKSVILYTGADGGEYAKRFLSRAVCAEARTSWLPPNT